jgi:hypothetical protein
MLLLYYIAALKVVLSMVGSSTVYSLGVLGVRVRSVEEVYRPKPVGSVVLAFKVSVFYDRELFSVILRVLIARVLIAIRIKKLESSSSVVAIE